MPGRNIWAMEFDAEVRAFGEAQVAWHRKQLLMVRAWLPYHLGTPGHTILTMEMIAFGEARNAGFWRGQGDLATQKEMPKGNSGRHPTQTWLCWFETLFDFQR